MSRFNLFIHYLFFGMGIGSVCATGCLFLMYGANEILVQVAGWLVASALYGLISLPFSENFFHSPLHTLLHCLLCYVVTVVTAFLLGYSHSLLALIQGTLPVFLIIYVAVCVIIYLYDRQSAKTMNEKLQKK